MVLGLSRRPKGEADWMIFFQHTFRFPLRNLPDRLCVKKPETEKRLLIENHTIKSQGRTGVLPCDLCHFGVQDFAAQDVEMQVVHGLTGVGTAVGDHPVTAA